MICSGGGARSFDATSHKIRLEGSPFMKRLLFLLVILLSAGSVARASTLLFTLSGIENGSFTLNSNPTPDDFVDGQYTKFINLSFNNGVTTDTNYQIIFFSIINGGAFADIYNAFGYFGSQLYTG